MTIAPFAMAPMGQIGLSPLIEALAYLLLGVCFSMGIFSLLFVFGIWPKPPKRKPGHWK